MSCRFSIIVPTFERAPLVRRCLQALAWLDYPREDFEVIIVDDGSAIPLADLIPSRFDGLAVTILRIPNAGPGAARNAGARHARGRLLAFTDDDCMPQPSWLRMLENCAERNPGRLIGGRTINALRRNPWSTTSQVVCDMAYNFYNADPESPRFFASNNMAIPADLFAAIGGFLGEIFRVASEDRELCDRWRHAGHALAYAPDAIVEHAHELGLRSFCEQHFRYGRGAMRYHRIRARRGSGRFRQDAFFYLQLPRLLRRASQGLSWRQTAVIVPRLLLWQICNIAGYVYECWRALRSDLARESRTVIREILSELVSLYSRRMIGTTRCFLHRLITRMYVARMENAWKRRRKGRPHRLPRALIVSLTSYPPRFGSLYLTLKSLLLQTVAPDRLILWIAHDDRRQLPQSVVELEGAGVEIRYCEDLRAYKKIIPTRAEHPDAFIVTADDDLYYWPTWLEEMVDAYRGDDRVVICHWANRVRVGDDGKPLPYMQWEASDDLSTSELNFPGGLAGIFYPPGVLHRDVQRSDLFMTLCPNADDVWLYWMTRLNGGMAKKLATRRRFHTWPESQEFALWHDNVNLGLNDKYIARMNETYRLFEVRHA